MLTEHEIDQAHPEAFDFAFGNLPQAKRAEFNRHLASCPHCRKVVTEYAEIGEIIKLLPPHAEPPADLEDRTIAAMVAALAEQRAEAGHRADADDQAVTQLYPIPEVHHGAEAETKLQPRPQLGPGADTEARARPSPVDQPAPAGPQAQPMVTRLPVWRRYRSRLAAVVAAAAVVIAAIAVPLSLSLGHSPAQATVVIRLHATAAAKKSGVGNATAVATARQVGESWTFTLSVHGLKPLPGSNDFYECWWVTPGRTRLLATGGSFVVGNSGSTTVTMTTGVDPTQQFRTIEITAESPSADGALHGPVLLIS
jgi:Putative zinc-finger